MKIVDVEYYKDEVLEYLPKVQRSFQGADVNTIVNVCLTLLNRVAELYGLEIEDLLDAAVYVDPDEQGEAEEEVDVDCN